MNPKIDTLLPVSWCLEFEDGTKCFDQSNSREWLVIKQWVADDKIAIRRMYLFAAINARGETEFDGVLTPEYPAGFFFSRRIIAQAGGPQVEVNAIGHQIDQDNLDIRWYGNDMSLIERETRPISRGSVGYIKNNV